MTEDQQQAQPTSSSDTSWTATLPQDLKALVDAKGYKSPAEVVQAYAHAQRLIGAEKIPLPKDGVWDETARSKLGIPTTASGYELTRPELPEGVPYDEAFESAALPVAHKLGLTPQQVQGLLEFYAGHQTSVHHDTERRHAEEQTKAVDALKTDWGHDYTTKVSQAARAARYFGGEELVNFLNDSGVGNNPSLIRAFARAGALLNEDSLIGETGEQAALAPDEAMRKARSLMSKPGYVKRDHPEHFSLVEQVRELFERAYAQPKT